MKIIVFEIKPTQPQNKSRAPRTKTSSPRTTDSTFEFCLSSAFHGLIVLLFISRIWLYLVQLKPDNKTPQYELYLMSWVFLPLVGIALTRLMDRFRPKPTPQFLYRRMFVFFNFILVLAAYWDVQTAYPWPLVAWLVLYLLTQAIAWGAATWIKKESLTAAIYLPMAVLFLFWLTQLNPGWEIRLQPWNLYNTLFAAALAYAFLIDLNPKLPRFHVEVNSRIGGLILYTLVTALLAFLFIDPTCDYQLFNQSYFVGPLADFINGKTMLVDINAQYGVFLYFFLKLIFPNLLPAGFHSFYFLDAVLRLGQYVAFFWITRQLFSSILYPLLGTVFLVLFNSCVVPHPLWYPSQGPLRFGFIYVLAALVLLRNRYPAKALPLLWLESLTVSVAFFWSFEACFYTVPPYLAFVAYETLFSSWPKLGSIKNFLKRLTPTVLGIFLIAAFIYLFTWSRAGQLPHWDYYFNFVTLYRNGFMMVDTPLLGPWWILVGTLYFSLFLLLIPGEKQTPHKNIFVLVTFYGIFQLFYYFGRSVYTNLYPIVMPAIFLSLYWLYVLRVNDFPQIPKIVKNACLGLFLGLLLYAVQPVLSATQERLDSQCRQMSPREMVNRFWISSRDLPRDESFAKNAEKLMEKYSKSKKFLVYFFGDKGIEVALYDGRSKIYPYDDIDQPSLSAPTLKRILAADPHLKSGDYVYTSPDMGGPKPILGTSLNLEETLFKQLNSSYILRFVETSGSITVYRAMGEKAPQTIQPKPI